MSLKGTFTHGTLRYEPKKSSKVTKRMTTNSEELNLEISSVFLPSMTTLKEYENHKKDILDQMIEDSINHSANNSLGGHNLNPNDRAKAVEWMLGKVIKLQCSKRVFFKSVAILDLFHARTTSYIIPLNP